MRTRLSVVAVLLLAVAACRDGAVDRAPTVDPTPAEIVDGALRSVVLVVTWRGDTVGYGSGFLAGDERLVLTNHHVVAGAERIQIMPWRPGRLSYTPMDGGLKRFLFENQRDLMEASVVREDMALDLAVLEAEDELAGVPPLVLSDAELRPGDRVYALGHPGETVWSFTAGVVSALHRGVIQHDAAINGGSSGGPLVDHLGRVVGLNTAKLLSGTEGVGFARPAAMVRRLLDPDEDGAYVIDFADLRASVLGCFHAQELGASALRRCFDWDQKWTAFVTVMQALGGELGLPPELVTRLTSEEERQAWLQDELQHVGLERELRSRADVEAFKAGRICNAAERLREAGPFLDDAQVRAELARAREAAEAEVEKARRRRLEDAGFQPDLEFQGPIRQTLKMGIRIEAIRQVAAERAWVLLAGRNLDGSPYRLSEHWVRKNGRWYQQLTPTREAVADLPDGWPGPLGDWGLSMAGARAGLLEALDHLSSDHSPLACDRKGSFSVSG